MRPRGRAWQSKLLINDIGKNGYRRLTYKYHRFYAHRVIWFMVYGEVPKSIDHIDGDRLNNKIKNLRSVTHRENCLNAVAHRRGNPPWCYRIYNGKWVAKYKLGGRSYGKSIYVGIFDSKETAYSACLKSRRLNGQ